MVISAKIWSHTVHFVVLPQMIFLSDENWQFFQYTDSFICLGLVVSQDHKMIEMIHFNFLGLFVNTTKLFYGSFKFVISPNSLKHFSIIDSHCDDHCLLSFNIGCKVKHVVSFISIHIVKWVLVQYLHSVSQWFVFTAFLSFQLSSNELG